MLSDLQMAATYAGLGGAQERQNCEPSLAATNAGSGTTKQVFWGMLRPDAVV